MVNEERKEDTWSNLPTLLVWMIKARLDYPTNLRFAAVCKSWLHASSTYPSNYQYSGADDDTPLPRPPWIMIARDFWESKREFISTLTGEKYTIDLPDFCKSLTLFSKQGWLLLMKLYGKLFYSSLFVDTDSDSPLFLLNPFTKAKIELPHVEARAARGGFTLVDGNPHCIVIASGLVPERGMGHGIYVDITHPGDSFWTRYCIRCDEPHSHYGFPRVVIAGHLVYCVHENARVFVFDVAKSQWTDRMRGVAGDVVKLDLYTMEWEGKVLQVRLPRERKDINAGEEEHSMFCRLNDSSTHWEPLKDEDLDFEDTFWFLNLYRDGSCVLKDFKGGMKMNNKIYSACRNLERDGYVKLFFYECNKTRRLLLDLSTDNKFSHWVDMG